MTTQTGSISFESTGGLKSYAKQNYATLSQIKGQFATCGTGASTVNKVATIVPENTNWTLYEGATVTVKFISKNETATPTLNVNNTGAKIIKDYAGNALISSTYNWPEGAAMSFTYDGTYWRIQDSNLMERVHTAETEINQTATSITSLATLGDTYTKPDGTVGTNLIKSQFTQTASAINAKVDKNGVIASINASVEEENGSQIKISADKVNIEGAAIFNSGSLSKVIVSTQTQWYSSTSATVKADGSWGTTQPAITAGRYIWERQYIIYSNGDTEYKPSEAGVCIQGQTDLSDYSTTSQMNSAIGNAIGGGVGGFDILWNRAEFANDTNAGGECYLCALDPLTNQRSDADGWAMWNGIKRTITKGMFDPNAILPYNIPIYIICRLSSITATTGTNYMVWYDNSWKYAAMVPSAVNGTWTWVEATDMVLGKFVEPDLEVAFTECETYNPPRKWGAITTDTTTAHSAQSTANAAAPKTNAVFRTQRIYYRTNTALSNSITGPITWINESDNKYNITAPTAAITGWSTKPTPLAASTAENATKYLYLYTCIQTQTVAQSANNGTTCTASTVLLDDTETIIDGSKIITGSISANSINANSGTFNTANIPDLNAAKITSGDIATDRIKTNVIDAVNFSTDKIDADRINVSEINISDLTGEIGGRNLLKNTTILNPATVTWPANTSLSQIQDWYSYAVTGVSTLLKTNDGIKITHGNSSTNKDGFVAPLITDNAIIGEKEYVLSFEYKSNIANFDNLYLITSTKTNNIQIPASDVPASETEWAKYSRTIEFESTVGKTIRGLLICYFNGSGNWIEIKDSSVKLEKGSKATDWTPALEDINVAINDASKIASNYIHADSSGINIYDNNLTNGNKYYLRQTAGGTYIYRNSYLKARYEDTITLYGGSNESGANPKVELTSNNFKMTDGGGIQRLLLDSTDGAIIGRPDKGRIQITDVGMFVYDTNSRRRTQIDSDGLHLYDTDGATESAIFSPTSARIGKENNVAFYVNSDSLQAYYMNGSTRTKYFEVTPNGMSFGTNTVASQSYVTSQGYQTATQVTGLIDTNQNVIDAKKHTQVLISAANVDYSATGSATAATFTARLYIDGTVQTSTDLKWLWYKDGTVQGSVQTAANGTLTVTGSMGLDHRYSCRCEF